MSQVQWYRPASCLKTSGALIRHLLFCLPCLMCVWLCLCLFTYSFQIFLTWSTVSNVFCTCLDPRSCHSRPPSCFPSLLWFSSLPASRVLFKLTNLVSHTFNRILLNHVCKLCTAEPTVHASQGHCLSLWWVKTGYWISCFLIFCLLILVVLRQDYCAPSGTCCYTKQLAQILYCHKEKNGPGLQTSPAVL